MSDISDLEQRLAAALRRISTATEALPKAVIIGGSSSSIDPTRAANQKSHAVTLAEVRSSLAAATSKLTVQEEKIEMLVQALENTRENQVSPVVL